MQFKNIIYEKKDGVAWIIINRPQVMNALDIESRKEILAALQDADSDKDVRVVVLTGSGDKAFCAGADLRIFREMNAYEARDYVKLAKQVARTIETLSKPVIAVVKGYALGGGLELVLACDLVIASEDAKFGQTELNVGLIPGVGGTQRLPRVIGIRRAKEMIYTGQIIDAEEAYRLGLVNKVVPAEKLNETLNELLMQIKSKSPLILKLAKQAVNKAFEADLASGLDYESELFVYCFTTEDQKEGVKAFLEKRRPEFKGR
jgi:enoyl-CoA hydratase